MSRPGRPSVQHTGTATGWDDFAVTLSLSARSLHKQDDPHATLDDVVAAAVDLIPGAEQASISAVVARRRIVSEAASGELPRVIDALQEATGWTP